MGHQIVIQPNGKLAVWSTGLDDFIILDATEAELINYYSAKASRRARETTQELIDKLKNNEKPYLQFTLSWDEMMKIKEGNDIDEEASSC